MGGDVCGLALPILFSVAHYAALVTGVLDPGHHQPRRVVAARRNLLTRHRRRRRLLHAHTSPLASLRLVTSQLLESPIVEASVPAAVVPTVAAALESRIR